MRGLLWYASGDIAWKILSVAAITMIMRMGTNADATVIALSLIATTFFVTCGDLGYKILGTRALVNSISPQQEISVLKAIQHKRYKALLILGIPMIFILSVILADNFITFFYIVLISIGWSTYFLIPDWFLVAKNMHLDLAKGRILASIVVLFLIYINYLIGLGVLGYSAAYFVGYLLIYLICHGVIKKKYGVSLLSKNYSDEKIHGINLHASIIVAVASLATLFFHNCELLAVSAIVNQNLTAEFSSALKLILVACSINWILSSYLAPKFARSRLGKNEFEGIYLTRGIGLFTAVFLYFFGVDVYKLIFANKLGNGAETFKSLSLVLVFDGVASYFCTKITMRGDIKKLIIGLMTSSFVAMTLIVLFYENGSTIEDSYIYSKYLNYFILLMFILPSFSRTKNSNRLL